MSESFSQLFESSTTQKQATPGNLLMGTLIAINNDKATIDVGLKSEGFVSLSEFKNSQGVLDVTTGDVVEVLLKSIDDGLGNTILSYSEAKTQKQWTLLETAMNDKQEVTGIITGSVKGGLVADISGVKAFLPGSLVDTNIINDLDSMIGQEIQALIIKMEEARNSIVISRKAVLLKATKSDRDQLIKTLKTGLEIEGIVKNLANYGAFIDIGGIDGLLHITDISWKRITHPSDKLTIGDKVTVKILKYDEDKQRVSLGLKQLTPSPWNNIMERFPIDKRVTGIVTTITDYGAFVRIDDGVEGLVHVSEMDWTNANPRPSKVVKTGQEISVVVLSIQESKHRISLSMKQAQEDPYKEFESQYKKGDKIRVVIKSITDFGLFVGLPGSAGIEGLVHINDVSEGYEYSANGNQVSTDLAKAYPKGHEIEVSILNIDTNKNRISLGIKQLHQDNLNDDIASLEAEQAPKNMLGDIWANK